MHKYLRAIGFSTIENRNKLKDILTDVIMNSDTRDYTLNTDHVLIGEFCKNFAPNMGISVCGEFDEDEKFIYEYYYPYLIGNGITTREDVTIEKHAARDSYAGVCEDMNIGISMIFYLQNHIPYVKALTTEKIPMSGTTLTMSALSVGGIILFPILKTENQRNFVKKHTIQRNNLLEAARKGNEEAIETLTLEDMDTYSSINQRVQNEDLFSIVDTYFMPYGMECDQYNILGEITQLKLVTNDITGEKVYILTVCCNELTFDVCINIIDLVGEPAVGRRFKGTIWLQGNIHFPEDII